MMAAVFKIYSSSTVIPTYSCTWTPRHCASSTCLKKETWQLESCFEGKIKLILKSALMHTNKHFMLPKYLTFITRKILSSSNYNKLWDKVNTYYSYNFLWLFLNYYIDILSYKMTRDAKVATHSTRFLALFHPRHLHLGHLLHITQ